MEEKLKLLKEYEGINRYAGVPTEQTTGRLHYNENLYGPSPKCLETLKDLVITDLYQYESGAHDDLTEALAEELGIPAENIFLNNGSAENIKSVINMITATGNKRIVLPDPGWSYYYGLADYKFCDTKLYHIREGKDKCYHDMEELRRLLEEHKPALAIITSPAMPTGNLADPAKVEELIHDFPQTIFLMDEAYLGFAEYPFDAARMISEYDNIVFSRTFSKYYGLANLRIGYAFCSTALRRVLWLDNPLHRLPHINKRMAIAALKDKEYYDDITSRTIDSREQFIKDLNSVPDVLAYRSDANFVYVKLVGYDVEKIKKICEQNGYLIRIFGGENEKHLRITIDVDSKMPSFTAMLLDAIKASIL